MNNKSSLSFLKRILNFLLFVPDDLVENTFFHKFLNFLVPNFPLKKEGKLYSQLIVTSIVLSICLGILYYTVLHFGVSVQWIEITNINMHEIMRSYCYTTSSLILAVIVPFFCVKTIYNLPKNYDYSSWNPKFYDLFSDDKRIKILSKCVVLLIITTFASYMTYGAVSFYFKNFVENNSTVFFVIFLLIYSSIIIPALAFSYLFSFCLTYQIIRKTIKQ